MERSEHHAPNVDKIALALIGAIIWKKDGDSIKIRTHKGKMVNVLWVTINGNKYAFCYNHDNSTIELRLGKMTGPVKHKFSNSTPISCVKKIFENL